MNLYNNYIIKYIQIKFLREEERVASPWTWLDNQYRKPSRINYDIRIRRRPGRLRSSTGSTAGSASSSTTDPGLSRIATVSLLISWFVVLVPEEVAATGAITDAASTSSTSTSTSTSASASTTRSDVAVDISILLAAIN